MEEYLFSNKSLFVVNIYCINNSNLTTNVFLLVFGIINFKKEFQVFRILLKLYTTETKKERIVPNYIHYPVLNKTNKLIFFNLLSSYSFKS